MKQSDINDKARSRRMRALQLVDDEDKSYREAGEIMGVSPVRINQMVHRARKEIRELGQALNTESTS